MVETRVVTPDGLAPQAGPGLAVARLGDPSGVGEIGGVARRRTARDTRLKLLRPAAGPVRRTRAGAVLSAVAVKPARPVDGTGRPPTGAVLRRPGGVVATRPALVRDETVVVRVGVVTSLGDTARRAVEMALAVTAVPCVGEGPVAGPALARPALDALAGPGARMRP